MKSNKIAFRPAHGCPYTQRDVDVIGGALSKMAQELKVDIRQLKTRQVRSLLDKDKNNPLWGFIDMTPKKAMAYWIRHQISHLIRCVRYDRVDIPRLRPQPLFEDVKDTSLKGTGGTGRAKVFAPDAFDKEGIATRIADGKVTRVKQAVQALSDWVAGAKVPTRYEVLVAGLEGVLEGFDPPRRGGKAVGA